MDSKDLTKYLPDGSTWLRAAVSSIPLVGSALDHLLFDKADAIRLRNIEAALGALSAQIARGDQERIDKDWFASEEALAAFKMMADGVSYEPDRRKIEDVGRLVAVCGDKNHSMDEKKLSVLDHLSRLSHVQIKILSAISRTAPKQKTVKGGDLNQTTTAIWMADIMATLKAEPKFWEGTLVLDQELEVLESLNTIRRLQLMGDAETAYQITAIGKQAASYVRTAGL